jgi:membrane protein implicated in regulation of membrane protease activity
MKINKRQASRIFLILGMVFLVIGIVTDNTAFSWAAVAFIIISLLAGGRWLRPRKR